MDMSFKEKSTWISLVSTLAIFGYYFYNIFALAGQPAETANQQALKLLVFVIILSVVVEAVFHSLLAAANEKAAALGADERDKSLEYKSNSIGYTVLAFGVLLVIGNTLMSEYNPELTQSTRSLDIPLYDAHLLMMVFIFSEVVRFGALIFNYRRGI